MHRDRPLIDLFAQRAGVPLYHLAAGSDAVPGPRLEMLHMLASRDLSQESDEAKRLRAEGYRQWNIKVGAGSVATDVDRVQQISRALQGDVVVMADAFKAILRHHAAGLQVALAVSGTRVPLELPTESGAHSFHDSQTLGNPFVADAVTGITAVRNRFTSQQ